MPGEKTDVAFADSSSAPAATGSETPLATPASPAPGVPASQPAAATTPDAPPASSSSPTPAKSAPPTPGEKKGTAPDPVEEAKAKLIGRKPAPPSPAPKSESTAKAATPPPATPRQPDGKFAPKEGQPAPTAKTEEQPSAQKPDLDPKDPLAGFSPEEQSSFKSKTRERITTLHQQWRAAETAREQLEKDPAVGLGKTWADVIEREKLHNDIPFVRPEHLGGLVRVQAAINRAEIAIKQGRAPSESDAQMISGLIDQSHAIAEQLGIAAAEPDEPEITPLEGELAPQYRDLVDLYGVPEASVRLLAAIEARQKPAGTAPAAKPQPRTAAPAPTASPAPQPTMQRGVDMDRLWGERLGTELVSTHKVPAERLNAHMAALMPVARVITREMFPTVDEAAVSGVFNALPAHDRFEIMLKAQQRFAAKPVAPAVPATHPPPATTTATIKGSPPPRTAPAETDPVKQAMNRLIRGGQH